MIDNGHGGSWLTALQPDHRSVKYLSEAELHGPFIIENIARWHGITLAKARDMRGAECLRRTRTNDFPKG